MTNVVMDWIYKFVSLLENNPWWTLFFAVIVYLGIVFIPEIIEQRRVLLPSLSLNPSSGPSQELLLNVSNLSETDIFRAECRFIDKRNNPNPLKRTTYPLRWAASQTRDTVIKEGRGSENLLIANFSIDRTDPRERLLEMIFPQFGSNEPAESSRWVQNQAELGAEYDIEINIWGEEHTQKPYVAKFTVRAEKGTGPLEMVRIDE